VKLDFIFANCIEGHSPKIVPALVPVVSNSRISIVTLFGEWNPTALGRQRAGKMLGDVGFWS
jgi:hypothetical protein